MPMPGQVVVVVTAAYWAEQPTELRDALTLPEEAKGRGGTGAGSVGIGSTSGTERHPLTVEEAAQLLGISRAFAYEAVRRGEIPSIKIGRRLLVPKAARHKLVGVTGDGQTLPEDLSSARTLPSTGCARCQMARSCYVGGNPPRALSSCAMKEVQMTSTVSGSIAILRAFDAMITP